MSKERSNDAEIRLLYGGKLIKTYREQVSLSSRELSVLLECKQPTLSNIENGTRPLARQVTPEALGQALGLSVREIDKLRILYLKPPYKSSDHDLLGIYYEIVNDWTSLNWLVEHTITEEHIQQLLHQNASLFERFPSESFDLMLRPILKTAQFDKAIDVAKKSLFYHNEKSYVASIDLHNNLAECYLRKAFFYESQYEAELLYQIREKAIVASPFLSTQALENYKSLALESFHDALLTLFKVRGEIKNDVHILNQLALTHYNIGKLSPFATSDSVKHLNKAIEYFDKGVQARFSSLFETSKETDNQGTIRRCIAFKAMSLAYLGKFESAHELLQSSIYIASPSESSAFWAYVKAILYSKTKQFSDAARYLLLADHFYELSAQKPQSSGYYINLFLQDPDFQEFYLYLISKNIHLRKIVFSNTISHKDFLSVRMVIENEV